MTSTDREQASGVSRARWFDSTAVRVLAVVLVVTAVATLLATARYGIALIPDSVVYVDGARSLANGDGFARFGNAITQWPPGYPAVLSIAERIGIDAEAAARGISVLSFVATTLLGFVLLRRHVRRTGVIVAGTVVIGCSAVLLQIFKRALSEHLFIVVVLLLLLAVEEIVKRPQSLRLLGAAIVLVWAGFYLRYAGIVLVPFLALVVLVAVWPRGVREAVLRSAAAFVLGLSVPVLWMIRNSNLGKGPLGVRHAASATPGANVTRAVKTIVGWISLDAPGRIRMVVLGAVIVVVAVLVIRLRPSGAEVGGFVRRTREVWPLIAFVALYIGYIGVSASIAAFADIDTRFLSPVYVPLVVLGAWTFERLLDHLPSPWRVAITVVAVSWIALNVGWFGVTAVDAARHGAGDYATARWHRSRLLDDAQYLVPGRPIYSNDIYGIELFAERAAQVSPAKTYQESNEAASDSLPGFLRRVRCAGHVTFVWFLPNQRPYLYTPKELSQHARLTLKVRRADRWIYDVTPLPSSSVRCRR